jgi:signal transduction histidine kinase
MIQLKNRHLRVSIILKLLILILPLVCLPVAGVGYLSYRHSVKSVTQLSMQEQLLQAEVAAAQIDTIIHYCRSDLETLSKLVSENYPKDGKLPGHTALRRDRISVLFRDFLDRSSYYNRIRLVDRQGNDILAVPPDAHRDETAEDTRKFLNWTDFQEKSESITISDIVGDSAASSYLIHYAIPVMAFGPEAPGGVIIDLDYNKVIALVRSIEFGSEGYAFMVDGGGRIIAHPLYRPYDYDLTRFDDSRLREFVVKMISGDTGWQTFHQEGERAAAYAPVPAAGWSIAVSVPISEFSREAQDIRTYVIQIVIATLVLSGLAVSFLSYKILKPVRRLVVATQRVAGGDLSEAIPVHSADEFGLLTRSFNHMVQSLHEIQTELLASERLISMGKLSAGVAHEIRNPLNAMKGAIVFLQRRRQDDPLSMEYTGIILEEIDRLNRFVTEFLSFSGQSVPKRVAASLNGLIKNILNLFEEEFRMRGIRIETRLDREMPDFRVDPQQLEQVFINLLVNGMDAMPGGGRLKVASAFQYDGQSADGESKALVWIEDCGMGIAKDLLDTIFEPFYSTKESGTGLGLPISKGIVEAHGGHLHLTSEPGLGTTVHIVLPVRLEGLESDPETNIERDASET